MSLHPKPIGEIPEETRRIAQTAFPKGNLYMKMRDELGTFYRDEDFEKLYPCNGQTDKKQRFPHRHNSSKRTAAVLVYLTVWAMFL
jgi:hypothetical protein